MAAVQLTARLPRLAVAVVVQGARAGVLRDDALQLLDHFLRVAAGQGESPFPTDQVRLMALISAAYRSAKEGREVEV